jgi:L-lactate dehydrogenase complex protein LldF
VKIDIPSLLVHLRQTGPHSSAGTAGMGLMGWFMGGPRRWRVALVGARAGSAPLRWTGRRWIRRAPYPMSGWTRYRDAPLPAPESFHQWWRRTHG